MSCKNSKQEGSQEGSSLACNMSFSEFLAIADKYIGKENMCEFSLQYKDMQISFSSTPKNIYSGVGIPAQMPHNAPQEEKSNLKEIKSNMVGTLYTAPSPTEEPYVSVGSQVKEGQTIFIIEAMKVMSHFKSTHSGIVKEILVHNEETVEFGKVLARLE